ncbi:hypothetical protein JWG45_15930 [Leptospira sp. 201903070]|uniref:DUF2846 domain-containing protein n=1 Tax=Leptospira ainlahdjerensis TaxID=2810033 RepID=A0ABS2UE35_9LEPT|nr:hypothetical protein [Leptospira ainlahdjerensis]MBM9578635.1 hypothetical protein [Leptospira ainlahdjerensis]
MGAKLIFVSMLSALIQCSYYIPYKFTKLPISESDGSFLIFRYNRVQENKNENRYILNPVLRYGETYLTPAYNLNPENSFWKIFYKNPDDLPYSMIVGEASQNVYYTEGCEYYIPIPIGEYYLDIEFRRVGQSGFIRQKVKIDNQQSLYLDFEENPDAIDQIILNLRLMETMPRKKSEKCYYKD